MQRPKSQIIPTTDASDLGLSKVERRGIWTAMFSKVHAQNMLPDGRIDLDKPRYDQSTFSGRAKHFFIITNPLNLFSTSGKLEEAKKLVQLYRKNKAPPGVSEDEIWRAKHLYDSAFHPETGEKMFLIGRMSAQVPMNMFITGCMMTFYKSTPAVVFWQWFNQSFNAIVNYTNRSGDSPLSTKELVASYVIATVSATGSALALNRMVVKLPPIVGRYVPFAAVAVANCINIPFMRNRELAHGIPVLTEDGEVLGTSQEAAKRGIAQVVFSRIIMAVPGMSIPPLMMFRLEKRPFLMKYPMMTAPVQVGLVGMFLVFATPLCCALFPQISSISVSKLEPDLQKKISSMNEPISVVYYNKGL
ncbi:Sideroflexin-1 [Lamellibrachia satsuma]|nr:Sideroflexin-1 [Lamellibrachia satsuma]